MLKTDKLSKIVRVSSLIHSVFLEGPDTVVSCDLILRNKQIGQASILIIELYIVSVFEVVGDRFFVVRIYQAVNEVKISVKAVARQMRQYIGVIGTWAT